MLHRLRSFLKDQTWIGIRYDVSNRREKFLKVCAFLQAPNAIFWALMAGC